MGNDGLSRADLESMLDYCISIDCTERGPDHVSRKFKYLTELKSLPPAARAVLLVLSCERIGQVLDQLPERRNLPPVWEMHEFDERIVDLESKLGSLNVFLNCFLTGDIAEYDDAIEAYLNTLCRLLRYNQLAYMHKVKPLIRYLRIAPFRGGPTPRVRTAVSAFARGFAIGDAPDRIRLASRALRAVGLPPMTPLPAGEAWSERARADLAEMTPLERDSWAVLLDLALDSDLSAPCRTWLDSAFDTLPRLDTETLDELLCTWLSLAGEAETQPRNDVHGAMMHPLALSVVGASILKGLCWIAGVVDRSELVLPLSTAAEAGFSHIEAKKQRSTILGHAAIASLGIMTPENARDELISLKSRLNGQAEQNAIDRALQRSAKSWQRVRKTIDANRRGG